MSLVLHTSDHNTLSLDKPELNIGSDPTGDLYLANSGISSKHAVIRTNAGLTWLTRPSKATGSVHVNGRLIHAAVLLKAGDEIHFDAISCRIKSSQPAKSLKPNVNGVVSTNFSERIVLRVLTGSETGMAYALINSLCIGRSSLSDVQVDDSSMAERQVLLQRQGNDVVAKNLSPILEMQVDGWVCNEAILAIGSQLCIDQHRYLLQSSCPDFAQLVEITVHEVEAESKDNIELLTPVVSDPPIFTRAQWILLASSVLISGLLILLLTIAP
jgi:hypothetical protein